MKKLNQAGLAAVYVLLAVVIIGAAGFFAYSRVKNNNKAEDTAATNELSGSELVEELDPSIRLVKSDDTDDLPTSVPASFVTYMKGLLADNKPDGTCISAYYIDKVSTVNMSGETRSVDATSYEPGTDDCFGGAGTYYYLQDDEWTHFSTQELQDCDVLVERKIYSEFIEECLKGNGTEEADVAPNPVGSIEDAEL